MKSRMTLVLPPLIAISACQHTGSTNNSNGVADLTHNNSAFRGGAAAPSTGDAPTNANTGVTGGNGGQTVTAKGYANGGTGKTGANPSTSGGSVSAPGTH
jgi:hypothetical protein